MSPPRLLFRASSFIVKRYFKYSKSRKFDPANCLISLAVLGPRARITTSFLFSLRYFNTGKKYL